MKITVNYILRNSSLGRDFKFLSDTIREFFIVEDLENMFLTAQLSIDDAGGIFEELALTGNEIFDIELIQQDPLSDKEEVRTNILKNIKFEIYNIESVPTTTSRRNKYTFTLAEQGYSRMLGVKYSKSYSQKKISDIIKDIYTTQIQFSSDQEFIVEETSELVDFIIPYWKPSTSIKYLVKLAKRNKSPQESGYLFFSSLYGTSRYPTKYFVSIASLLEKQSDSTGNKRYYLRNNNIPVHYINNILDYRNPTLINNGNSIRSGIRGKKYIGVDFHNDKNIMIETRQVEDFIKNSIFLGEKTHLSNTEKNTNSEIEFKGQHDKKLLRNEMNYNFRMNFESLNRREILCRGSLDRYAGKIIEIEEVSGVPQQGINPLYSGTWLIKSIVTNFTADTAEQRITIIKDSLGSLEFDKVFETTKRNI